MLQMRGVYPILVMPFDDKGRIDVESLQRLVDFEIEQGAHGIGVALGSEVMKLSEEERVLVTRVVVSQARGRVPVVINSGGSCTEQALLYSRMAEENGADALMVLPPSAGTGGNSELRQYYKSLSDATNLPIMLQDTTAAHISADLARAIAEESERVRYVKVESQPATAMVAAMVEKAGDLLVTFGGTGGTYFLEEMRRGSQGTMPGCSDPKAFVQVWNLYQAGDVREARDVFYRRILPVNRLAALGWASFYHVHKEILRQRGIIANAHVRGPVAPLDELTRAELQEVIDELFAAGTGLAA